MRELASGMRQLAGTKSDVPENLASTDVARRCVQRAVPIRIRRCPAIPCPSPEVFRQLRLLRAVEPYLMPLAEDPNDTIENAIALLQRAKRIAPGDKLVVATDILAQDRLVDSVQLRTVR